MKLVFAGTPEFAATHLNALLNTPHDIAAVFTQPDRPAGRGRHLTPPPVKQLASSHKIPIHQPQKFDEEAQILLKHYAPDLLIVVAYGLILPSAALAIPHYGAINVHASLLPRWRGAAPIQQAILAGDDKTGITTMQMDEGMDTGDMLLKSECPITSKDTGQTLHDKLASLGTETLIKTLAQLATITPEAQNHALATYAKKIKKADAHIQWQNSAEIIDRQVRAFNPWPVAFSTLDNQPVRIWESCVIKEKTNASPGSIHHIDSNGIDVATGHQSLRILRLQLPGGKPLPVTEILRAKKHLFENKCFN